MTADFKQGNGSLPLVYPTPNALGGGMIVTDDPAIERAARSRNQGMERRYENETIGFNTHD